MRKRWACVVVLGLLGLPASAAAAPNTAQVTATTDTGGAGCELRDAISAVTDDTPTGNCTPTPSGADMVTFAPALNGQTIALDAGQISIANPEPMSIVGPGMGSLIVDADANARVFRVEGGSGADTISGMTIQDGNPPPDAAGELRGGCIRNQGALTLTDVRVTGCTASIVSAAPSTHVFVDGGAIGDDGTALTINNSLVDTNTTTAINSGSDAFLAQARGAIYTESNNFTMNDTTVDGNTATGTDNGTSEAMAVAGVNGTGSTNIFRSTISDNTAVATETGGNALAIGGIRLASTDAKFELSTVAGNRGDPSGTVLTRLAGGVWTESNNTQIRSSTITDNGDATPITPLDGANFHMQQGTATVSNTIISDPQGGGGNCRNGGGTVVTGGFNVDFPRDPANPCFDTPAATDLSSDPLLAPAGLASNGGPTQTIALQNASPAIDAGLNSLITLGSATQDQRGSTRPVDFSGVANAIGGNGTDIGAFEVQQTCAGQATPGGTCPSTNPPGGNPSPGTTPAKKKKKCKKKKKKSAAAAKKCKRKKRGKK
jgi:hypothetical protein